MYSFLKDIYEITNTYLFWMIFYLRRFNVHPRLINKNSVLVSLLNGCISQFLSVIFLP